MLKVVSLNAYDADTQTHVYFHRSVKNSFVQRDSWAEVSYSKDANSRVDVTVFSGLDDVERRLDQIAEEIFREATQ